MERNMNMNFNTHSLQAKSRIDLWVVLIEPKLDNLPAVYIDMLCEQEMQRYYRFRLESDRQQHVVSHALLRMALSRVTGGEVDPRSWRFTEDSRGKPVIAPMSGLPSLNFNLSHSGSVAAIAISSTCPLGVDIEPVVQSPDTDILDSILSTGELAYLNSRPALLRQLDFVRLWTLKESYSKLLGRGLSLDFSSFEIMLDPVRMSYTETNEPPPVDLYLETCEIEMPDSSFYQLSLAARRVLKGETEVVLHVLDSLFIEQHCYNWSHIRSMKVKA